MNGSARMVRVAVVGDAGVGKTSLISTAATDTYDQRPPPQLPPTRLPAEFSPERVPMLLTDTSSRPEDAAATDLVLQQADVVVICFEARRPATLDSVRTVWYPRLQQLNSEAPVVLACCKSDRLSENDQDDHQQLRERVERCVYDLPNVEVCLNCSARTLRMVTDIFGYALKSVLFPMQPLYDRVERRLRPLAIKALKRVFIICDSDKDNHLNNQELNDFQQACFGLSLTDEELTNIKHVVREHHTRGVDPEHGLTLEGFLYLHILFIERGRLESTWAVLRNFGYTDDLRLSEEVLDQVNFSLPPDQVYELSDAAIDFLTETFCWYDDDQDGQISHEQLQAMFSTAPQPLWQGERWSRILASGTLGSVLTLEAFLLKWRYAVLSDPRGALAALLYLGWGSPAGWPPQALLTRYSRRRRADKRHDLALRTTLHCYVFGSRGCGKTALLKALAGRQPHEQLAGWAGGGALTAVGLVQAEISGAAPGSGPLGAAGMGLAGGNGGGVQAAQPAERTLVLSEISEEVVNEWMAAAALAANSDSPSGLGPVFLGTTGVAVPGPGVGALPDLSRCDVAAFVFDSSSDDSFRRSQDMLVAVSTAAGSSLPCVLVAAKDDLGMAQKLEAEVVAACTELALRPPISIAAEAGELAGIFRLLAWAALHPAADGLVPDTPARKAHKRLVRQLYIAGAAAAGTAAIAAIAWRLYNGAWLPVRSAADAATVAALEALPEDAYGLPPLPGAPGDASGSSGGSSSGAAAPSSNPSFMVNSADMSGAAGSYSAFGNEAAGTSGIIGGSGNRGWFSSVAEPNLSSLAPLWSRVEHIGRGVGLEAVHMACLLSAGVDMAGQGMHSAAEGEGYEVMNSSGSRAYFLL